MSNLGDAGIDPESGLLDPQSTPTCSTPSDFSFGGLGADVSLLDPTVLCQISTLVGQYAASDLLNRQPYHTSSLKGGDYTKELLAGNANWLRRMLGVTHVVFFSLKQYLVDGNFIYDRYKVGVDEQLAIFLYIVRHGASNALAGDRFCRGGATISRAFHDVLNGLVQLHYETVQLPGHIQGREGVLLPLLTPKEIRKRSEFYPYFKNAIGACDGTHILGKVSYDLQSRFRSRKGFVSQNVFAACSFDFRFLFLHPGWEGSAHDGRVFEDAVGKGFTIPNGKYYLFDAGYRLQKGCLTPYRGVRYHLKEQGAQRPENKEELFNLRHAKLRNVIERIFGALKKRFGILKIANEYPLEDQINLVLGLTAIHNLIQVIDVKDNDALEKDRGEENEEDAGDQGNDRRERNLDEEDDNEMKVFRDALAQRMWEDYLEYREQRGY